MIRLTRLNTREFVVNAEMIEFVEALPDTMVSLVSGKKFFVAETVDQVIERVVDYRRQCQKPLFSG